MGSPKIDVFQVSVTNPDASAPLSIPMAVICNTPDEQISANIKANSALDLPWLKQSPAHDGVAVIVGGGPSVADDVDEIFQHHELGHKIFAINGAASWLGDHDMHADYQVTCDAQPRTADLIDIHNAHEHLIGSQVDPTTIDACNWDRLTLWHLDIGDVEQYLPTEKVKRGGYALIGGGASSGNSALCIAYCMGFRNIHVFGFDSSHRGGQGHAYPQPMNDRIPVVNVNWAGKNYSVGVAMKAQAEKFQITASELQRLGCTITVHGSGLLPDMWRKPVSELSEQDIYTRMWMNDDYRVVSFGEMVVPHIMEQCPTGTIVDYGCGTGRASVELSKRGREVFLVDFAENCRDDAALGLGFLQWDLTRDIPLRTEYGICCDVMEHIAPDDVDKVLSNLREACTEGVFFRIEHEADVFGPATIGRPLHLTVQGPDWWLKKLHKHWPTIDFLGDGMFMCRTRGEILD